MPKPKICGRPQPFEKVYARSMCFGIHVAVEHAHMRGYVVKIVVINSFEGVTRFWSGTAVFFFCFFLAIIRCSIKCKKSSWPKTAMRRNGEIDTKCGQGRYKRKEYSCMKVLPSLRLSACLAGSDGQCLLVQKLCR